MSRTQPLRLLRAVPSRQHRATQRKPVTRPSPDLFAWAGVAAPNVAPRIDPALIIRWATGIWNASINARHAVLFERWAASQNLTLPDDISDCIRFHANLRNGDARSPGLVFLMRCLHTDEAVGILRLFLDETGNVIGRRTLGRVFNSAIQLDASEHVESGLHIIGGLDISGALAARAQGYRPIWVVNSVADFPLLAGIECLTIIGSDDDAVAKVSARWRNAGREINLLNETPLPR